MALIKNAYLTLDYSELIIEYQLRFVMCISKELHFSFRHARYLNITAQANVRLR